ncbi:DNA polymerase III subunit gamma/tau [Brevundimonas aveniformis]|uniref:DNA polymerase III subunit gamma/tau n=1 Tax=Brevundimonas aveniformis TaxID=370977 RepID=UPI00249151EC|nr:DNA polymerase III subunit gamma/tau [Brevundimonas aveniformis]
MAPPDIDSDLPEEDLDAPERDENTSDMFGGGTPATQAEPEPASRPAPGMANEVPAYTVLARKYRPRTFEDLIGQEAMVRTLTNAFSTGRIAHAFMLTGVRGVGKTTTARLLARALNYETDTMDRPSVDLTADGRHCAGIIEGRHMDVLELDAASRTGVDDMRELLDSVRYAPVEARYKVYVIDEVHMLSKGAFNALLKTLEEPPAHAKFIFATTEIRKVPVTILSRCQRFDLRRVEPDVLSAHLEKVATQEGCLVESEALALIARAAEGSVRDGLSLLDQALVQAEAGQTVKAETVRDMLGLADRAQTIALFELIMSARTAEAMEAFRTLYGFGADPEQIIDDLLEHCHMASVAKTLGPAATRLPNDQAQRMAALGTNLSAGTLARVWQLLLKAHEEVRRAPDPAAAAEMAILRLAYASDLPSPEDMVRRLQSGDSPTAPPPGSGGRAAASGGGAVAMAQPRAEATPLASPQTFDETVALIESKRDVKLLMDVRRFVKLVSFQPGRITFEPVPDCPPDLTRRLVGRLREWTGRPWLVATEGGGGGESLYEQERRRLNDEKAAIQSDPFVLSVLEFFPGAELINIRKLANTPVEAPVLGDVEPTEDE